MSDLLIHNAAVNKICDVCGLEICLTPFFCAECRRLDDDPKIIEARKNAQAWPRRVVAKATLDAAAWLYFQARSRKRFEQFLSERSKSERGAILTHIAEIREKRHG